MKLRTAVVFLVNEPHNNTLEFAMEVRSQSDFDVFIVIDDTEKYYGKSYKDINMFQISDKACGPYINSAYIENRTMLKKTPTAWDKFLYHFCENVNYDFVWVFEDDVFIPSVETIVGLNDKYFDFDLVTANNFFKNDSAMDWHWPNIFTKIDPPYFYSMVCGMGISAKCLKEVKKYAHIQGSLFFHEAMFNTLAMQAGLRVKAAFELRSIVWQGKWDIDEFLLLPNNVFHPIKDLDKHPILRKQILMTKDSGYTPVDTLPEFLKVNL